MRQGRTQAPCTITVDVPVEDVDAGSDFTLNVRVSGFPERSGRPLVVIRDQSGLELARTGLTSAGLTSAPLTEADGEGQLLAAITLAAPPSAGDQLWRAVAITADKQGTGREEASAEVRFTVRPHTLELIVWDAPSAIEAGQPFRFTAGIRCSSACSMGGMKLSVTDGRGQQVATASFAASTWPGTDALYAAQIQAVAPDSAGDHEWQLAVAAADLALPHTIGVAAMRLKVVPPADCLVAIEVLDEENRTPIAAARVVMHPYRATADASGIASLRVTKGQYDVLVAGTKYTPVRIAVDVGADILRQVVLEPEPPLQSQDEG